MEVDTRQQQMRIILLSYCTVRCYIHYVYCMLDDALYCTSQLSEAFVCVLYYRDRNMMMMMCLAPDYLRRQSGVQLLSSALIPFLDSNFPSDD